jgi:hypothetical protein
MQGNKHFKMCTYKPGVAAIPVLKRLWQEDGEFKGSLGYIQRSVSETKKKKKSK